MNENPGTLLKDSFNVSATERFGYNEQGDLIFYSFCGERGKDTSDYIEHAVTVSNAAGKPTEILIRGKGKQVQIKYLISYDENGKTSLIRYFVRLPSGVVTENTHYVFENGRMTGDYLVRNSEKLLTKSWKYDEQGKLTDVIYYDMENGKLHMHVSYLYYPNGLIKSLERRDMLQTKNPGKEELRLTIRDVFSYTFYE